MAAVNPDLAVRDGNGEIYTVCYDAVNAMLLNKFLKEHKKAEEQQGLMSELKRNFEVTSAQQQREIRRLTVQLKEQAARIEKVSAQIEVNTPAAPLAATNP